MISNLHNKASNKLCRCETMQMWQYFANEQERFSSICARGPFYFFPLPKNLLSYTYSAVVCYIIFFFIVAPILMKFCTIVGLSILLPTDILSDWSYLSKAYYYQWFRLNYHWAKHDQGTSTINRDRIVMSQSNWCTCIFQSMHWKMAHWMSCAFLGWSSKVKKDPGELVHLSLHWMGSWRRLPFASQQYVPLPSFFISFAFKSDYYLFCLKERIYYN